MLITNTFSHNRLSEKYYTMVQVLVNKGIQMECCGKPSKFTKKQWSIICVIGCVHFTAGICISLQAPFYPQEAESKNVTSTEYGFVFGVFELVAFTSSPILGSYVSEIGPKILLCTGVMAAAVASILFGLLDLIQGRLSFLILSFVIRIIEALGASAAVTSAFAITAAAFPENVATVFATLEIFFGVGNIVGPTLGGLLFALGGYMLPFIVVGVVMVVCAVAIFFILPTYQMEQTKQNDNLLHILKVPSVLLDLASVTSLTICTGFYAATLEPHIRNFNLTPIEIGFVFIAHGGMYAVFAPFVGRMCDSFANPKYLILIGNVLCVISVILVGPLPGIPAEQSLALVIPGLLCLGFAMAFILVSAFIDAIRSAIGYGFSDGIKTYGLVSGLWSSSFSLGDFIGASSSGALYQTVGFRLGSLLVIVVHICLFTCMVTFLCVARSRRNVTSNAAQEPNMFTLETQTTENSKNISVINSTDEKL